MSQVSYGTITITDTNDIERIYTVYAKSDKNTVVPSVAKESWSENVSNAPGTGNYIWQRTVVEKSGTGDKTYSDPVCLTGEEGTDATEISDIEVRYGISANWNTQPTSWSADTPAYDSSKPKYWTRTRLVYDTNPATYSDPVYTKDEALTKAVTDAAIANSIAQQTIEDSQGAMSQANNGIKEIYRVWYRTNSSSTPNKPSTHVTETRNDVNNIWTKVKPIENSNYRYYFYCEETITNGGVSSWTNPVLDITTLSKYEVEALDSRTKTFFFPGDSSYPGAYVVGKNSDDGLNQADISTYGFNTRVTTTGISIGYNAAKVLHLKTTPSPASLDFYKPPTISGSTVEEGELAASLSSTGLILNKGGVKAGTPNQSGFIYLSTEPYGSYPVNGSSGINDWKEIIGTKFGVRADGTLYANEAHINGAITATSLTISSNTTISDTSGLIRNDAVEIGGRNLLKKSNEPRNNSDYAIGSWYFGEDPPKEGEIVTIQIKGKLADAKTRWGVYNSGGSISVFFIYPSAYDSTTGIYTYTGPWKITVGSTTASNVYMRIYAMESGQSGTSTIEWVKLERGNKPSDWTAAPEDAGGGGKNLLYNSGIGKVGGQSVKGWRASGGTVSHVDLSSSPVSGVTGAVRVTNNGSSAAQIGMAQDGFANSFIAGELYSQGAWIRGSSAFTCYLQPIWNDSNTTGNSNDFAITTDWQYYKVEGLKLLGTQQSTYSAGYFYARNVPAGGWVEVCGMKLERGAKATDWTPAPEDVQSEIDAKKSTHTLSTTYSYTYAQLLTYSNEYTTAWTVSSTADVSVGDTVRLKMTVSDMSNAPVYIIGTVTEIVNATRLKITSHGIDTTVIDGGNILTNSITANQLKAGSVTADKIVVSDPNNYVTISENDANSLIGTVTIVDGWCYKGVASSSNAWISPSLTNWASPDERYRVTGIVKMPADGRVRVTIYGRTAEDATATSCSTGLLNVTANTEFTIDKVVTIPATFANFPKANITIDFFNKNDNNYAVGYFKKMRVERMSGGSLIVDGSITADHIKGNTLTLGKFDTTDKDKILNDNVNVGGRNLFGYGSDCSKSLDGMNSVGFSMTTEDGFKCAHASGEMGVGKYLQSKIPFYPKANEVMTISAWVKIKNIVYGTGNPSSMCEFYTGGQTIDGGWRSYNTVAVYLDGVKANTSGMAHLFTNLITDTNWHKVDFVLKWQNYAFTINALPSVYLRNATGDLYVRHIKYERGNKATDWTPATEDVASDIDDASKVADNYLKFTEAGGLDIGYTGKTERTNIKADGMRIYDSTSSTIPVAEFLSTGAQIGKTGESYLKMDYHSMQLIDKEGDAYFHVSDLRTNHTATDEYGEGFYAVFTETYTGNGTQKYFGINHLSFITNYKVYVNEIEASNVYKDEAGVLFETAPANGSTITITYPTAVQTLKAYTVGTRKNGETIGAMSFAEGSDTIASGRYSHAGGKGTTASGFASFACGESSTASGGTSFACGNGATASGGTSFACGNGATASGAVSFACGYNAKASGIQAIALGQGAEATGNYSTALGNGAKATKADIIALGRSVTVDQYGNVWHYGDGYTTTGIVTGTVTAGYVGSKVVKYGNVCQLSITCRNTSATASGKDIFTCTISEKYRPIIYTTGGSYYGSYAIGGAINTNGTLWVRNADSRSLAQMPTSNSITITFTYMVADKTP